MEFVCGGYLSSISAARISPSLPLELAETLGASVRDEYRRLWQNV
jgi:hypothetical protein